ncbi:MAG: hypothetical protein KKA81_17075 [Bacteroidetes bacterium]|nr:hypothetical protein [Bacteroidota bacterium]
MSKATRIADGRQQVGLVLDQDVVERLDVIAKRESRTRAQVMAIYIENGMDGEERINEVIKDEIKCDQLGNETDFTNSDLDVNERFYHAYDENTGETDLVDGYYDHIENLVDNGLGNVTLSQLLIARRQRAVYSERRMLKEHCEKKRKEQTRLNAKRKPEEDTPLKPEESKED